jgi:phenylacetate-CoA ligase
MLKFKGTSLYPPAIYDVLNQLDEIENYIVEVRTGNLGTDEIKVIVGSKNQSASFAKLITEAFRVKLRVAPEIAFEQPQILQQQLFVNEGRKPMVFKDLR